MGFDNPSERPLKPTKRKRRKAAAPRRGSTESERGRSAERAAPARAEREISRRAGAALTRNGAAGTHTRSKRKSAKRRNPLREAIPNPLKGVQAGGAIPIPKKAVQVAGGVGASIGKALSSDPGGVVKKTGTGVKDIAKGIPSAMAAIGVAGYDLARGDSTGAKDVGSAMGGVYKTSYGDIYKASTPAQLSKAVSKNAKRIEQHGAAQELLDSTLLVTGAGAGLAGARAVAKAAPASRVGRAADAVAGPRPALRKTAGGPAQAQRKRSTLVGATASHGVDVARRRKQKRIQKRAAVTGESLAPHRAALKPGEVAPLHKVRATAKRSAVRRGAGYATDERTAIGLKTRRELTARKGPGDHPDAKTLRANLRELPDELRPAAKYAQQLGIRNADAGKAVLTAHLANVVRERAARPVSATEATLRHDEVPAIQALIDDPSPFNHPAVQRHADVEGARAERVRSDAGRIGDARAQAARRQPQDTALGIAPRVADETVEAYTVRLSDALNVRQGPLESAPQFRARLKRAHESATAQGRVLPAAVYRKPGESADAYSTRLARELDVPRLKGETTHAHRSRILAAVQRQSGELPAPRRKGESLADFEARRADTVESAGLVEPGFVRSRYEDPDTVPSVRGIGRSRPAATSTSQHRTGELFTRGQESLDPRTQEHHLAKLIREGEQLRTESKILEREGMRFDSRAEAEAYRSRLPEKERALWDIDEPPLVREGLAPASGPAQGRYVPTESAWLVPTGVVEELTKQRVPLNATSAALLRTNAGASATLLALSPKWFAFQVVADSITLSAAGGISQILRNTREYRALPDHAKDIADVVIGGSPRADAMLMDEGVKLGVVGRALDKSEFFQKQLRGQNPLTALLRAEGVRAHEFRRAALMTELRKNDITRQIDAGVVRSRKPLSIISKAMAKPDPAEAIRLLSDQHAVETAMAHVDEIMGNFSRYTSFERAALRPLLGFYGFLRYATRMAFWTLPVGHPIAANIAGHLGSMGAERTKDILGEDMAYQIGVWYGKGKNGKIRKLDLRSVNPVGSALMNVDNPAKLLTLMGPAWTAAMSTMLGRNLFLDAPMTVKGDPTPASNRDIGFVTPERARIALNQALNLLPPVRALNEAQTQAQSSDSLPGSRRPLTSLSPTKRAELMLDADIRRREGTARRVARVLLPPGIESAEGDLNKARKARGGAMRRLVEQASKRRRLEEFYDDPDKLLDDTDEAIDEIQGGDDIDALMERYDELVGG